MAIRFNADAWNRMRENYGRWWAGELKRPLIHMTLTGADPGRPPSELPAYGFTSRYDLSIPAEKVIDAWDYTLSANRYLGDGFPCVWPNFGAGVAAAFMGATLTAREDTTWFHPEEVKEITHLSFAYDPDNVWLGRVKDICRAGIEYWQGAVQIGMTDIGGALDILSTFRPSESLILDTCMYPEEVKKLTWDIHELWWKYFEEIDRVLQPVNPGYTAWTPILSEQSYYMLQCDFCYMLGPDMFEDLVKPELAASCKILVNPFYHLDGPGQLVHLDSILEIDELKGIQWVPGAGQPDCSGWPEVYKKIRDAGKLIQLVDADMKMFDTVAEQLGSAEGLIAFMSFDISRQREAAEFLEKYGAPASSVA
ncbi:MAG: hypothetical protein GF418_03645 [Chitinivibrionales bacterium]|nr:hypothetical protein [Chitinivibrionales bacterium]MBD3394698.1 hypothetical protein [Chitinivibrionales bacterium]